MEGNREQFGSKMAAVMALAGSAVGLGNIWRFPYMVGEYGGAIFLIFYLFFSFAISLPVFYAEAIIGKSGKKAAYGSMEALAPGSRWKTVGEICVIACFIITSYYSVVGGWSVDYLIRSCMTGFENLSQEAATGLFGKVSTSVWEPIIMHTVFLALAAIIIRFGIKNGIEKFTKIAMPLLFVLMICIMLFSLSLDGAEGGVRYMLRPDFSKFSPRTLSSALGQSFFSMSLGVGCVLTYSSYMRKEDSLATSGLLTSISDLSFALIAAFVVMPAVFSAGLEPGAGPSLVFESLPYIFAKMGQTLPVISRIVTIFFFLSVFFAALTSLISMFEVCTAHLVEEKHIKRSFASIIVFTGSWLLGILCSLSFGVLGEIKIFGKNIFGFLDMVTSNYLMILGALAFVIFVGWKMGKAEVKEKFTEGGSKLSRLTFNFIYFIIKYVAPVMILAIFISNLI